MELFSMELQLFQKLSAVETGSLMLVEDASKSLPTVMSQDTLVQRLSFSKLPTTALMVTHLVRVAKSISISELPVSTFQVLPFLTPAAKENMVTKACKHHKLADTGWFTVKIQLKTAAVTPSPIQS